MNNKIMVVMVSNSLLVQPAAPCLAQLKAGWLKVGADDSIASDAQGRPA